MAMNYQVRHRTQLSYAAPVMLAEFNLRLAPVAWPGQKVQDFTLTFDPIPRAQQTTPGPYPSMITAIRYAQPLSALEVTSGFRIEVDHDAIVGDGPDALAVRDAALASADMSNRSPVPYLYPSRIATQSATIGEWAATTVPLDRGIVAAAHALTSAIHREFAYRPGVTTSATAPETAFAERKGVCQDFAHVMIVALRALGLPAAYISGYLRTVPPPGSERLIGADAMHAWVAVWCGADLGWIGFDPTNDCLARNDHIVIAMGRDYADVSPIDGVFVGIAPQTMDVMVDVAQV